MVAMLCIAVLAGFVVLGYNVLQCGLTCCKRDPLRGEVCCYTCDCHEAGLRWCRLCARGCLLSGINSWGTPECGLCCAMECNEAAIVLLIFALVILVLCFVAGIIWLLVAAVVSVMHAWKEYLRLRELRRMATDYVVEDLTSFPTSGAPSFTSNINQTSALVIMSNGTHSMRSKSSGPKSMRSKNSMDSADNGLDAPSQQEMENEDRGSLRAEFLESLHAQTTGAYTASGYPATFLLAPVTEQKVQSMLLEDLDAIRGSSWPQTRRSARRSTF